MLAFAKRRAEAALTWLLIIPVWLTYKKKACFKAFVFLSAGLAFMILVLPMNFAIREGDLSFQLAKGSLDGGRVQIPLGPAGWINLKTHAVPINLKVNLVVDRTILTSGQDLPDRVHTGIQRFTFDATEALWVFLGARLFLIGWIGACLGITISNGGRNWWNKKLLRNALIGAFVLVLIALGLIGISYLTLDRTPDKEYVGVSKDLEEGISALMVIGEGYSLGDNWFQNIIDGTVVVASQLNSPPEEVGTTIVCGSDFQGNAAGMEVVDGLVQDRGNISAVILAGDIVQTGHYLDTYTFRNSLTFDKTKTQVGYVDGNHEDASSDKALREDLGYKRLDDQDMVVGNLTIMGQSDPDGLDAGFEPSEEELENSSLDLLWRWQNAPATPNIVVVHELAQAKDIIEAAKKANQPLTVIYGHDHQVGHSSDGSVNLIDCGTSGAWGFEKIKKDPNEAYTFQILNFSAGPNPKLTGITTLEFYGLEPDSGYRIQKYTIN